MLTAFNRKISGLSVVEPENSGVTDVDLKKIAALTALKRKNGGVNGF